MNSVAEDFQICHYAFDGELLGSSEMKGSTLSSRWLDVTYDLLAAGPVFRSSLDGSLSAYELRCAAGICQFLVGGLPSFSGVLLSSAAEEQNRQLLEVFCRQLEQSPLVASECSSLPEFRQALYGIRARPAFVVVNWLNPDVSEQDQEAMFQLAYHFASSYFRWCDAT